MNAPATQSGAGHSMRPGHRACAGFTLVEILITAAVTIVAFTGLASLQVLSLRAADSSLERTQATALAYGMIDRLRLNRTAALEGEYDGKSICKNSSSGCTRSGDTGCGAEGIKASERGLCEWWNDANAIGVSDWYAGVARTGELFRVAVRWNDTRAEGGSSTAKSDQKSCLGGDLGASTQEICVMTQL